MERSATPKAVLSGKKIFKNGISLTSKNKTLNDKIAKILFCLL